MQHKEDIKSNI